MKERSGRWICRPFVRCCLLLLNDNLCGLYFWVGRECPRVVESIAQKIYLFIGQGAVDASAHYQTTILQNFLPCVLLAIGKDFKHALKDVLRMHSVNLLLLHISKTLRLTICAPSARHSTICDG